MIKKSEILKLAKVKLQNGDYGYVCYAITSVCEDVVGCAEQGQTLKRWISGLLQGCETYGSWLYINHPELSDDFWFLPRSVQQEIRILWVDWMISYWEERGE